MMRMFTRVEFGQGSVTTVVCRRHRAFGRAAEEMCLAGQLASLLYSSAKTASSSLLLEQDKPKTLPLPEIQKRRQNLRVSCILSFFLLQGILCAFRSRI